MSKDCVRWFGHIQRRLLGAPVRKGESINRVRLKPTWLERVKEDLSIHGLTEDVALSRNNWREWIHIADST